MTDYKAEYSDDSFEIIIANTDHEALEEAWNFEDDNKALLNVFEIDEDYNEIRTIL